MSYYDYQELKAAVFKNPTQDAVNALGEWFQHYGMDYWNGECFNADDFGVYPIYNEVEEDEFELVGYEIR